MALSTFLKNNEVVSCQREDSIVSIARQMRDKDVGAIIVVEESRPVGIITDRDIVVRCISDNLDAAEMTAEDLMTTPVHTIKIEEGLYDLVEQMARENVRRVVLIDSNDEVKGLLSLADVLELITLELSKLVSATGQGRQQTLDERAA